jgi:tetratricopeptide (TPR) repeat protein
MFRLSAAVCWLLALSSLAGAADPSLGQKVFWKPWAQAKVGNAVVPIDMLSFPATVEAVNGDWLWLGRAWVKKQDVLTADQALTELAAQILKQPKNAALWTCRGAVRAEKGDYDAAIKDFNEAIRLDPKQATAFSNRGSAQNHQGKYDAAIKDLSEAIRLNPRFAAAYNNRGIAWGRSGNDKNAIDDFGKAIQLDPKDPEAFQNRGSAWGATGQLDSAIADLTEALRLDSTDALAYFNRGNAWREKGELDRAIKDFNRVITLDPGDAAALTARAGAWTAQGQYDNAIKDYRGAIERDPKLVAAYNGLAWLQSTCPDQQYRDGDQGVENATQACQLTDWKDWGEIDTLAAAYAQQADFKQAAQWQEKAITLAANLQDKEAMQGRLTLYQAGQAFREAGSQQ